MTHFVARFPHISKPVQNPTPADYQDAAEWYRQRSTDKRLVNMIKKAEIFERTYRRKLWAQRKIDGCNEAEIA